MGKFKAVLFDFDGTLAGTEKFILESYNFALKQQGFKPINQKKIAELAGIPLHKCYGMIAPKGDIEKLVFDHRRFQQKNFHLIKKYPQAKKILKKLKEKRIKIAIVTGRYRKMSIVVLKKLGLWKIIDFLVAGDDTQNGKPNPDPFLKAMKKLKVKAKDCLVVGDGWVDVAAGKKAGCMVCRAMYGYGAKEKCKAKPDFKIKSLEEVLECIRQRK